MIPQAENSFCWASCLGGCSAEFSREHIVSRSTLPGPEISIGGFPFLVGAELTLHKNDFSSNILCRDHNSSLSHIDQAGTNAYNALLDAATTSTRRRFKIRGDTFERWLLKTCINIELLANFDTQIPVEQVAVAFGHRPFAPNAGLYYVAGKRDIVRPEARITMTNLHNPENKVLLATRFTIGGFHFLLALAPLPADRRTISFRAADGSIDDAKILYHPMRLDFVNGNRITIDWRKQLNTKLASRRRKSKGAPHAQLSKP